MPTLFKGQRFSTAGEAGGRMSCEPLLPKTHHPGEGVVQIRDRATRPLQPSTRNTGGAFVSLVRGASRLLQTHPPRAAPLAMAESSKLGEPFLQHSVNTQYCIKAINSHFKETETQFSHQSQEQRLAGLRNVTAQLAAPPPPPQPRLQGEAQQWAVPGCTAPPPKSGYDGPWRRGTGSASSSRELEEAREARRHGGTPHLHLGIIIIKLTRTAAQAGRRQAIPERTEWTLAQRKHSAKDGTGIPVFTASAPPVREILSSQPRR